jgi:hypothetical protein
VTVTDERLSALSLTIGEFRLDMDEIRDIQVCLRELQSARAQLAALQREHAASAAQRDARVAAADALARAAATDVAFCDANGGCCMEGTSNALAAYRAIAQPDAARPAGEMT